MEAEGEENTCYAIETTKGHLKCYPNVTLSSADTHTHFKRWHAYIFNTRKKKPIPYDWKTHFNTNVYKRPIVSRNTA